MDLSDIISAILAGEVIITNHAEERRRDHELSVVEILYATAYGETIEEYPDDFPTSQLFGTWLFERR